MIHTPVKSLAIDSGGRPVACFRRHRSDGQPWRRVQCVEMVLPPHFPTSSMGVRVGFVTSPSLTHSFGDRFYRHPTCPHTAVTMTVIGGACVTDRRFTIVTDAWPLPAQSLRPIDGTPLCAYAGENGVDRLAPNQSFIPARGLINVCAGSAYYFMMLPNDHRPAYPVCFTDSPFNAGGAASLLGGHSGSSPPHPPFGR